MTPKVITPPASPVLTLEEIRRQLKYSPAASAHEQDPILTINLEAARKFAEHYTGCALGQQTLEIALDAFPVDGIELPLGPIVSVTSVKYLDTDGVQQTLAGPAYSVNDYRVPARITPAWGTSWPATRAVENAVVVRYVTGSNTIDGSVKSALLLILTHWDTNPSAVSQGNLAEVPLGATALLDTVKVWSL